MDGIEEIPDIGQVGGCDSYRRSNHLLSTLSCMAGFLTMIPIWFMTERQEIRFDDRCLLELTGCSWA